MKTQLHNEEHTADRPVRVLHCLRAPVGGLFRHVCDLAKAQGGAGYEVGVLCADDPNDALTVDRIRDLSEHCALGVERISLGRLPGLSDLNALFSCASRVRRVSPDIVHGHGAKGGVLSRFVPAQRSIARVYTPHGGSVHYAANSLAGIIFGTAERVMLARTHGLILESAFAHKVFSERFGKLPQGTSVVHNGLAPHEFEDVGLNPEAADFVFLGELRELKGIFTLMDALADVAATQSVTLAIVGDGPDRIALEEKAAALALSSCVRFHKPMQAREAFAHGRMVVMPSHNDSFPYVALEAIAAGRPLLASHTGGIPEIFGPFADNLVEPRDHQGLARRMRDFLNAPDDACRVSSQLRARVRSEFSVDEMAAGVSQVYRRAMALSRAGILAEDKGCTRVKLDVAK